MKECSQVLSWKIEVWCRWSLSLMGFCCFILIRGWDDEFLLRILNGIQVADVHWFGLSFLIRFVFVWVENSLESFSFFCSQVCFCTAVRAPPYPTPRLHQKRSQIVEGIYFSREPWRKSGSWGRVFLEFRGVVQREWPGLLTCGILTFFSAMRGRFRS